MAKVVLRDVVKKYDKVVAVNKVNLEIKDKQFCVLVGPSGCGKSTTLRMVAGLEEITEGEILIDDKVVNDVLPKNRDIAMVFQNYALYPHMKAYNNMAFGLKLRGYTPAEIEQRVNGASDILGIRGLLDRQPKALSGGQRQRVAVGRAIVRKPKVFLFDEPLSNLDAKLRVEMRAELKKLHERLETTIIYVTHDQVEAMTLGDMIVVMKNGVIHQIADPLTLYSKPSNMFVGGFIGSPPMNFIEGKLAKREGNLWFSENENKFDIRIPQERNKDLAGYVDKEIVLGIRPENLHDKMFTNLGSPDNTIMATVDVIEPLGGETMLYVTVGKNILNVKTSPYNKVATNQAIEVVFDTDNLHLFDKNTEMRID